MKTPTLNKKILYMLIGAFGMVFTACLLLFHFRPVDPLSSLTRLFFDTTILPVQKYIELDSLDCEWANCIGYKATIFNDGRVVYQGYGEEFTEGTYIYSIPAGAQNIFTLAADIDYEAEGAKSISRSRTFEFYDRAELHSTNLEAEQIDLIIEQSLVKEFAITSENLDAKEKQAIELSELVVQMSRGACFGYCSIYSVQIFEDGTVVYFGQAHVKETGYMTYHLNDDEVDELEAKLDSIKFQELEDDYQPVVTCSSSTLISTNTKSVSAGAGSYPDGLLGLEEDIDAILKEGINPFCDIDDSECRENTNR